jgi:RecA/RadA recombinase
MQAEHDVHDQTLDHAIEAIRVRFGSHALTRAAELPAPMPWLSRTPLDRLTGIGGLPRGRLTLLTGAGTCGKLTLALALLGEATREFAHAVVVDVRSEFDPWMLLPFDPDLDALTVLRPPTGEAAGEAAAALARAGAGFILLMGEIPEAWLGPMEAGASRSGSVAIGVVETPGRAFAHASSLSLAFSRTDWIWDRGQLVGLRAIARCSKNRVAPPVGESELEIRYPIGTQPFVERVVAEASPVGLVVEEMAEVECATAAAV